MLILATHECVVCYSECSHAIAISHHVVQITSFN